MPVEDAADEGRDQERLGVRRRDRLDDREDQRHVAVDPLGLQPPDGFHSFPGRCDLDEDPLAVDSALLIEPDQLVRLGDRALGVERQVRVDLGRHAARDDLGHLGPEIDGDSVGHVGDSRPLTASPMDRFLHQPRVSGHLRRLENERRIGGRVGRSESADGLHVAGVGDDSAHGAQLFELVRHGGLVGHGWRVSNVVSAPALFKRDGVRDSLSGAVVGFMSLHSSPRAGRAATGDMTGVRNRRGAARGRPPHPCSRRIADLASIGIVSTDPISARWTGQGRA